MGLSETSREQRVTTLTRLALATREKVETAVYVVYVEDTAHISLPVFQMACRRLEHSSKWFPKVAELLEECGTVARHLQEQEDGRKRFMLSEPPVSPEKIRTFRQAVAERLQRMRMR